MKQWLETREVLGRLAKLLGEGKRAALATVVRVRGSAYRHEGAKMLVAEDSMTTGNVSGGCLEADVREVALDVITSRKPQLRSYCAGSDEIAAWDLGVGCDGQVEVLVEVVTDVRAYERTLLDGTSPFASCVLVADPGCRLVVTAAGAEGDLVDSSFDDSVAALARSVLDGGGSAIHSIAGRDVFIDVFTPPPQLVVVSAGDDASALVRFATAVGFRIIVVDRRAGLLTRERFPGAANLIQATPEELVERVTLDEKDFAVVMTHNYVDDREYLRAILGTSVPYIGLLGPRQRADRILGELAVVDPVDEDRVYGPIGLDIGADGAEQIAISTISEILAIRSGRKPTSLRERRQPIHVDVGD
jgi:xanthine/CO dehydrogenase XdhC/CoxF family maturation factor